MITLTVIFAVSTYLFLTLLAVCRGFAAQGQAPEPYEVRLWAKYSGHSSPDAKKAA